MEQRRGMYYSFLQTCMEKKDLMAGRRLHCLLFQDGLFTDSALSSHLIRLYAACGHLLEATQVFLQAPMSNVFTWSAIISAYAKLGQGERALTLFHEMHREKLVPDKHVILAALKGCADIARLDHVKVIHCLVLQSEIDADLPLYNSLIDTYAKCRSLLDARSIFDRLVYRDIITWSALMTGYAQLGEGHVALSLHSQMQLEGVEVNRVTFISILKACSNLEFLTQCKFIHVYILAKNHDSDRVVCNTLIDAYAKCKGLEEAHSAFFKISNRDVVSWNAIITAYTSHGCAEQTFRLFDQMQEEGIKPDKYTIVSMLKACSTTGALEEGKLLYAHFVESGFKSDCFINNSLVDLFGKCGDLEEARRVFDKLSERSVVTWSAMISSHSLHGQESQAFDAFLQMQKERKRPDNYTYGSILRACSNVKALNKGKLIHEHIVENESEMDVVLGSALVDMYVKCDSLDDARMLFDSLAYRDVVTWSTIISGYVQFGAGQEALVLFEQMLQQRGKPNSVTFMSALKACSSLGAIHEGRLIYGLIIESSLELDKLTGNALVDMYSKCGSVQDAAAVFSSMLDKDIVTWNALIAGYALQSDYSLALLYFESMQQEGIRPDDITFLSLLSTCNHLGLVDEGRHHFLSMQSIYKIMPTIEHFNCVVDLLGRTGHLKEAGDLLQLVPFEARSPGLLSLLSNCSSHGDPDVGRKCYDSAVVMDTCHAPSCVHISNLYNEFGMVEEANKLLESKSGTVRAWKKPGKAFIEVYNKVFDFTVGDRSHPQTVDIFAKLKRLNERMEEGHVPHLPFTVQPISEKLDTQLN